MYQTIAQIAADPKVVKQAKKWIINGRQYLLVGRGLVHRYIVIQG